MNRLFGFSARMTRRAAGGQMRRSSLLEPLESRTLLSAAPTLSINTAKPGVSDGYQIYTAGEIHTINYTAADADSPATIDFFYDVDRDAANGGQTAIAYGLSKDSPQQFQWDTSSVQPGLYYIYGHISDGENTAEAWWNGGIILAPQGPNPTAIIDTTMGVITVELDQHETPLSTANFRTYAQQGFYNGTIFHRSESNVVQGGGMTADLTPKEGNWPIYNENLINPADNLSNLSGTIGVARQADPHSGTSQFYFNVTDNYGYDYNQSDVGYVVFGRVTSGMDIVVAMSQVPVHTVGVLANVPVTPIVINSVTIVDPEPTALVGVGGTKSLTYTEADGTIVTIKPSKALVRAYLSGDVTDTLAGKKGTIVYGQNLSMAKLYVVSGGDKAKIKIKTSGGTADVKEIGGTVLGKLDAKTTNIVDYGVSMLDNAYIADIKVAGIVNGADVMMFGQSGKGISIQAGWIADSNISLTSYVKKMKLSGWSDVNLYTSYVTSLDIRGDMRDGSLQAVNGMKKMKVTGMVDEMRISSNGNINSIDAGGMCNTSVFAGVNGGSLSDSQGVGGTSDGVLDMPSSREDLTGGVTIGKLKVKGKAVDSSGFAFSNTNIAASVIGKLDVAGADKANGGVPFGVLADYINSIRYRDWGADSFTGKKLDAEGVWQKKDMLEVRLV